MKRVGLLVAVCLLSLLHSCIAHEYHDPLACSWMKNATFKAGKVEGEVDDGGHIQVICVFMYIVGIGTSVLSLI